MEKKKIWIIGSIITLLALTAAAIFWLGKPVQPVQPVQTAAEWLAAGEKYLLERNYEEAWLAFNKAIAVEPKNISAYLGAADAAVHLEKTAELKELLIKAMEETENPAWQAILTGLEKSAAEAYIAIAEAYEAEGLKDRALELLQRVYEETGDLVLGRKLGIVQASEIVFKEDYVIQWQDAELERLIRQYLNKPADEIHYDDVKGIERLFICGNILFPDQSRIAYGKDFFRLENGEEVQKNGQIKTLMDLVHFPSLKELTVNYQLNLDISALGKTEEIDCLKRLETLSLKSDDITDISVVSGLFALQNINLSWNKIEDVSPLSYLIELEIIGLHDNPQIASVAPLQGLRKLRSISLSNAKNVDLSVFLQMPELEWMQLLRNENVNYSLLTQLNLSGLEISVSSQNFPIICQLKSLSDLRLHTYSLAGENQATDQLTSLSGIENLTNLKKLSLSGDKFDLSSITALGVEELQLDIRSYCDFTPLRQMKNLKKVIIPSWNSDQEETFAKVKALLPDIEVTRDRY